jgi:hypothetical protein
MVLGFRAVEDPGELLTERAAVDPIEMKHCGMRRQARPYRRSRMIFRPIDNFRQGRPIGLICQCRGPWFCPGHNQPIDTSRPQLTNILIAVVAQPAIPMVVLELW